MSGVDSTVCVLAIEMPLLVPEGGAEEIAALPGGRLGRVRVT